MVASGIGEAAIEIQKLNLLQQFKMIERRIWQPEQDSILKELFENQGVTRWSKISQLMEQNYGIRGRNGKQCRERYHNHLRRGINKERWSIEEEVLLIELHSIFGNRWALISSKLPGRTENCVKNMLYSRLRRAVRQINRQVPKITRPIKVAFIYRLIDFTENAYQKIAQARSVYEVASLEIKRNLLNLQQGEDAYDLGEAILKFKRDIQRHRAKPIKRKREILIEPISLEDKMEGDSLKTNEEEQSPPVQRIEVERQQQEEPEEFEQLQEEDQWAKVLGSCSSFHFD